MRRLRRFPLVFAPAWGGLAWSDTDLVRGYLRLSAASLVTTFIITQRSGACQRIVRSDNRAAQTRWLPPLADGTAFATVGISHLTTSRRHLARPVLTARETDAGFVLDGYSPWVTGAVAADVVVLGATLADGRQILAAVDARLPGYQRAASRRGWSACRPARPAKSACRACWFRTIACWPARWKT